MPSNTLQPPKPPPEKYGLEGYSLYLRAYEIYVKAYNETGKVDAKVEKAKLYSQVAKVPEKGTGTAHKSTKVTPAKATKGTPKNSGTTQPKAAKAAGRSGALHSRNLRRERRKLAAKLAEFAIVKRFADENLRTPLAIRNETKRFWPKARIVPGYALPRVFADLKVGQNGDRAVRWVNTLTVERVARGGIITKKGELVLPDNVPPTAPGSEALRMAREGLGASGSNTPRSSAPGRLAPPPPLPARRAASGGS